MIEPAAPLSEPSERVSPALLLGLALAVGWWYRRSPTTAPRPPRRNPPPADATVLERRLVWRAQKAAQKAHLCPKGMQAHHPNYTRPLDVECLPPRAHKALHLRLGRAWKRFRPGAHVRGPLAKTLRRQAAAHEQQERR